MTNPSPSLPKAARQMAESRKGHLAMLFFSALVAGSFSLGGRAANLIDPAVLTVLRFLLAACLLAVLARASGGLSRATFQAPGRYLLLGGLMALYFVLMFEGLKTAAPIATSAVFTLTPLIAAGFGWVLLRQRMTGRIAIAMALGGAGAVWVIFRGDFDALMRLEIGRGEAIYFIGCIAHALYAPLVRKLNRGEGALAMSCAIMTAGSLVLLIWSAKDLWAMDWAAVPALVWITLIYLAVAATAISTTMVQYAAMRLPASKVMAYTYLVPSWVILWELALGATAPSAWVLIGVVLTCAALVMLLKDETKPQGARHG